MSESLDLVRSIFAEWERGDYTSARWAHPEIEYVWADGPSPGSWNGLEGMAEAWGAWLKAWVDFRAKADGFRALDSDRVLVLNSFGGHGKSSGVGVEHFMTKGASIWSISNGCVTRLVLYWDREHALADLGLAE
jgi:ketosteroid isomerase-like protein